MENLQIKRAGLKVTLPRVKILALLEKSDKRHVSAEDVYRLLLEQGDEIGLATVYRVLTQFEAAGLVCTDGLAEESRSRTYQGPLDSPSRF